MDYSKFLGKNFTRKIELKPATIEDTQEYYKEHKGEFVEFFKVRVWRSMSWIKKAASVTSDDDLDFKFVSLWIAFNALYGKELSMAMNANLKEASAVKIFLNQICNFDRNNEINSVILSSTSRSIIQSLAENKYTYSKFWSYVNSGKDNSWEADFEVDKDKFIKAQREGDTVEILSRVFSRLYTIRNQIIHGGSTCGSYLNRQQVSDGASLLLKVLPIILIIMMKNYSDDCTWGLPFYMPQKED